MTLRVKHASRLAVLGVLATAPVAGCAVEAHVEHDAVATTRSPLIQYKEDSISGFDFTFIVNSLKAWESTFTVRDSHATFTPSDNLAARLKKSDPTLLLPIERDLPPVTLNIDKWWSKSGTATVTSLDMKRLDVSLGDHTIDAEAHFSGMLHIQTSGALSPNPDIRLNDVSVRASFYVNAAGGLSLLDPVIDVDAQADSCDLLVVFGCKGLVDDTIASETKKMKAMLVGAIHGFLDPELAKPKTAAEVTDALETKANLGKTDTVTTAWKLTPGSATISDGRLRGQFTNVAPPIKSGCLVRATCAGNLNTVCPASSGLESGDVLQLQILEGDAWRTIRETVSSWDLPGISGLPEVATYRTCFKNAAGVACSAEESVTLDHTACVFLGLGGDVPHPPVGCLARPPRGLCLELTAPVDIP